MIKMKSLLDDVETSIANDDIWHDYKPYRLYAKSAIQAVYEHILLRQLETSDILKLLKEQANAK
jgi:hypothetical protein